MSPFAALMRNLARSEDLELHPASLRLTGMRDGVGVSVEPHWHTAIDDEGREVTMGMAWVSVAAKVPAFGIPGLIIRKQGMTDTIAGYFGWRDIQLGRAVVDNALHIQATHAETAATLLRQPRVLTALERCVYAPDLFMAAGEVQIVVSVLSGVPGAIRAAVFAAAALADVEDPVLAALSEHLNLPVVDQRIDDPSTGLSVGPRPAGSEGTYQVSIPWPVDAIPWVRARYPNEPAPEIDDPILASVLAFPRADPDAVGQLATDEIRPLVLELVHGRQGSVRQGVLRVPAPFDAAELAHVVDSVLLLRSFLQEAP